VTLGRASGRGILTALSARPIPLPPIWRIACLAALAAVSAAAVAAAVDPRLAPPGRLMADKVVHALCFAVLAALAVAGAGSRPAMAALLAWVLGLGVAIEWLQSGIPGRTGAVPDLAADVVGMAAGGVATLTAGRRLLPALAGRLGELRRFSPRPARATARRRPRRFRPRAR
jgi:VanZ family protein